MHTTRPVIVSRSRPSRAVRLGTVLVAAAMLVGVGAAIGRVTGDHGGSPAPADAPTTTTDTETTGTGPGPSATVDGVPIGYAHTRDGAIAAAANYAVVLDSPIVLDSTRAGAALDQVASTDARHVLVERFSRVAAVLGERLNLDIDRLESEGVVMRSIPAGYRVVDYRTDTATVAVWGTSVFVAAGRQAVGPGWGTTEFDLVWEGRDWRVAELRTTDGPIPPAAGSESAAVSALEISRFSPFWQTPPVEG